MPQALLPAGHKLVRTTLQEVANHTACRTGDSGMASEAWINRGRAVDLEDHQSVEDLTGAHPEDRM